MIKLYQFTPIWGLPDLSPFCTKVETYLRMAKIPYENALGSSRNAPKKKLPYIEDTENQKVVCDSNFILDYLKVEHTNIDTKLSEEQKMMGYLVERLLEDHMYFNGIYWRWVYPAGWEITKRDFLGGIPEDKREAIQTKTREAMSNQIYQQGTGRHSPEEIVEMGIKGFETVSKILGKNLYLLGNTPSSFDACTFAFLAAIIKPPIEYPVKEWVLKRQNLLEYCERMGSHFFPHYWK